MERIAVVCAILIATSTVGLAQQKNTQYNDRMKSGATDVGGMSSVPKITLKGYLVDKNCAYHAAHMSEIGPTHTTSCALAGASSLGVIQNGVFYPFDEKGSKKAA